jgi:hypothetical protein
VVSFVKALGTHLIDDVSSTSHVANTSGALQDASTDLLAEFGGAGLTRSIRYGSGRSRVVYVLVPDLSLRYSYRPGHVSSLTNGNAAMTFASLDTVKIGLNIPLYNNHIQARIQLSFVDILGPFSEGATRASEFSNARYTVPAFYLGFFVPRSEVLIAAPELSRNLAVGFGTAARLFRAVGPRTDPVTNRQIGPGYCFAFDTSANNTDVCGNKNDGSFTIENLEFSAVVKYVF